jgi:hypothetical protein
MNHKGYDKEVAKSLLTSVSTRKNLQREQVDNKSDYIELYEVHGMLPLSLITENDKDDNTFVQQMHVVSMTGTTADGSYQEYTLVKGREDKSPYILTNLLPDPTGQRAFGKGAVELLFDSQWMTNHAQKLIKDQLDLASKILYQTSDTSFVGRNATNSLETGDILVHEVNQPITVVANGSADIGALNSLNTQWQQLSLSLSSNSRHNNNISIVNINNNWFIYCL